MSDIDVSLIVCTRNRLESLKSTLASFESLEIPAGWKTELLVVDNGSTDGTSAFLSGTDYKIPLRTVIAPDPGLSRARNVALKSARGRVFVWTDDDVIVDPHWLRMIAKPILDCESDAIAGRVVIPQNLLDSLVGTPLEDRSGFLAATNWSDWKSPGRMVGANMAFAAHVLEKVPQFDERLGAGPDSLGFHEESMFSWQLLDAGYHLTGAPEAIVHHHFDVSRLDAESMCKIATRFGQSDAYVDWHWFHQPRHRRLRWRKFKAVLKRRIKLLFGCAPDTLEHRFQEAAFLAYHDEYLRCMRQPRKYRRQGNDRS